MWAVGLQYMTYNVYLSASTGSPNFLAYVPVMLHEEKLITIARYYSLVHNFCLFDQFPIGSIVKYLPIDSYRCKTVTLI